MSEQSQVNNLGKRKVPQQDSFNGEETHGKGSPVPGAFGGEDKVVHGQPNLDKAHKKEE